MDSKEPHLSKSTRLEKLGRISLKKEVKVDVLKDRKQLLRGVLDSYQPGGYLENLKSDPNELRDLNHFNDVLQSTIKVASDIQDSSRIAEASQRLLEILIQKEGDPEWIGAERDDDPRLLLFYIYFMNKNTDDKRETLDKLKENRFNDLFYADFVSKLDETTASIDMILESAEKRARAIKRYSVRDRRRSEDAQRRVHQHITALDQLIPRAQESAAKFKALLEKEKAE